MTLGAMKQFKAATGKDLWHTLVAFLDDWMKSAKESDLTRCRGVYNTVDFATAAELIHALVKAENKSIPIAEIEDAMFRVGWLPINLDDDGVSPYPLILVSIAHQVNAQFSEGVDNEKKLHAATKQQE